MENFDFEYLYKNISESTEGLIERDKPEIQMFDEKVNFIKDTIFTNKTKKKDKKIYFKGIMSNWRGIPPIANWANKYSSIIIENNLLYVSKNYIVNIDLIKKEFVQLLHSSHNIYYDNKFQVICEIKPFTPKISKMFLSIDSNGNICYFIKQDDLNSHSNILESNSGHKSSLYFREEKYISKISRCLSLKTALNINLDASLKNNFENNNINLLILGDTNGYLNILRYYFTQEKEIQIDKNIFNNKKLINGISTVLDYVKDLNLLIVCSSEGNVEFFKINLDNYYNRKEKNNIDIFEMTFLYESNLSFVFSMDYIFIESNNILYLSVIDKNGSFNLISIKSKSESFNSIKNQVNAQLPTINQFNDKSHLENNINFFVESEMREKNKFNDKSQNDEYLFFVNKMILKSNCYNNKCLEIFISSNHGRIYFTQVESDESSQFKFNTENIRFSEIPENPHSKNIFSIINFEEDKLILLGSDGIISIFNHNTKFFDSEIKTLKYKPCNFITSSLNYKEVYFYDKESIIYKYNHSKLYNGLQIVNRNPLKQNYFSKPFERNLKKKLSDKQKQKFIKIKLCVQANFNTNIFSIWEYNKLYKTNFVSVYDFDSDTRIYRQDLIFKVKNIIFAFDRKFEFNELLNFRKDLNLYENFSLSTLDNVMGNMNLSIEDKKNNEEIYNSSTSLNKLEKFQNEKSYSLGLNEDDIKKKNTTNEELKKKNIKKDQSFYEFCEKKYIFKEKYIKILQQIFSEVNHYELLHIIDEKNNYIVIDYIKNTFNRIKLKNLDLSNQNQIPKEPNTNTLNNFNQDTEEGEVLVEENIEKQKIKNNKINKKYLKIIPLIKKNFNYLKDTKYNIENLLVINYSNEFIDVGMINQIQDIIFFRIKPTLNNFYIFSNTEILENIEKNVLKPDESKKGKQSMYLDFLNFYHEGNQDENNLDSTLEKRILEQNLFILLLEDEKNLRIFRLSSNFHKFLLTFNERMNDNLHTTYVDDLIKSFDLLNINTIRHSNYKNFSNILCNSIKSFQLKNQTRKNLIPLEDIRFMLIASLIDNSLKIFEIELMLQSENFEIKLTLKFSINAHISRIQDISILSENKIASLSNDQSLKIWDLSKCKPINLPILSKNHSQYIQTSNICEKDSKKKYENIFPAFNKIINEAIYTQSFQSCNEFVGNFNEIYKNLKLLKENLNFNNDLTATNDKSIGIVTKFFNEIFEKHLKGDHIIDKKSLDYFIFLFCESWEINRYSVKLLIDYELSKTFSEIKNLNLKTLSIIITLCIYFFIFFPDGKFDIIENYLVKLKAIIEVKVRTTENKLDKVSQFNSKNTSNDDLNHEIYKIKLFINFISNFKFVGGSKSSNYFKELKDVIEKIYDGKNIRKKFFELLLDDKLNEAKQILYDNELYIELIILSKLRIFEQICQKDNKIHYHDFKKQIENFRIFIYNKQIYQAQKCQNIINVLDNYFNQ